MPWNFPLWQAMRFAAPALMAGNVGLLKHASNVPQTALFMQDLFSRAGFPEGAFQTLLIGSAQVEAVLRDDRVAAATLTGSGPAGQSVAAIAGERDQEGRAGAGRQRPVHRHAVRRPAPAARVGARSRAASTTASPASRPSASSCTRDVYDEFERLFVEQMAAKTVGDPMADGTDVGPLATEQQRDDVEELVDDAVAKGAKVLCGGAAPDGPGCYYPPTVLPASPRRCGCTPRRCSARSRPSTGSPDIDEAIELANVTEFGLGSNAWTNDEAERARFVRDLAAGMVFINGNVTSYPQLPFGGIKTSGHGRELSAHGIREFCNIKSIWVGKP